MITTVIAAYLSMNISIDHESENKKTPKKSLYVSLVVIFLISAVIAIGIAMTDGYTITNGILMGGILLLSFLAPVIYIYYLRTKREDEDFDE